MITQMLQNVDATSLSYAAVWGLTKDLHLDTNQFTWIASMVFFGYLIFEWPMGLVAQHWHTGKVVGTVVILWGLAMMATALCTNFGGLAAQRFFLGALQSILTPAWVLLVEHEWRFSRRWWHSLLRLWLYQSRSFAILEVE
jgi:MFS family permease